MTNLDPFSDEATAARRRLRTIQQNLGPFAEFVQRDPEQFAAFAEETADQIGQAAGFANGVTIADPETFASFIGQSSAQFEAETGSPSPIRMQGGTIRGGATQRPGVDTGVNLEAIAFGAETALFGPGRALAGNLLFEGASNAIGRSPLPTPVNTALEATLALAALKKGKIGPVGAGISAGIGGALGLGADALGVGQQAEQIGAGLFAAATGDVPFHRS